MKIYLLLFAAAVATAVLAEEVVLRGGSTIQAPILKQTDDSTVLDLGYDVLRVPHNEILETREDTTVEGTVPSVSNRLYTIQTPERITTAEAAQLYAPSVVVVKTGAGRVDVQQRAVGPGGLAHG